jgi:hypothetical protein
MTAIRIPIRTLRSSFTISAQSRHDADAARLMTRETEETVAAFAEAWKKALCLGVVKLPEDDDADDDYYY